MPFIDGQPTNSASFGEGTGDIALENVACTGSENTLLGCSSNAIFDTSCSHSEDAGVICEGTWHRLHASWAVLCMLYWVSSPLTVHA